MENPAAACAERLRRRKPLLLELGAKPRLPKSNRRRTPEEKVAYLKEQLAAAEAAAEAAKAKKNDPAISK